MDKKLFNRVVESMAQIDEILRGARALSREFHVILQYSVDESSTTAKTQCHVNLWLNPEESNKIALLCPMDGPLIRTLP